MRRRTASHAHALWILVLAAAVVLGPRMAVADHFGGDSDPVPPVADSPADPDPDDDGDNDPGNDPDSGDNPNDDPKKDGEPGGDGEPPDPCDENDDDDDDEGDPVSSYSGKFKIRHVDLLVPGIVPIRLVRRYDSQSRYDSPLGYGWAFTYDAQLYEYPEDNSVMIRTICGERLRYVYSGGAYVRPLGERAELTTDGMTFTLRHPSGFKQRFDSDGRLTAIEGAPGNRLEFTYDPRGRLPLTGRSPFAVDPTTPLTVALNYRFTRIEERAAQGQLTGRFVEFAYDEATGRLMSATAHDGRTVSYIHDVHAGTGLTGGNLEQVLGLEGIVHTFQYTDPNDGHNVTVMTLGQGTTPVVNTYDAQDRVLRMVEGPNQVDFDYSTPLRTSVTWTVVDDLGENPQAAVTVYEYDADGYLVRKTDALGYQVVLERDSQKHITRKEVWENIGTVTTPVLALERAVNRTWDSSGNLLTSTVTLDSGNTVTTTRTYDRDWLKSTQAVSSSDPTKLLRTEFTFFRDAAGDPINVHEIKRRRDDGTYETRTLSYDANGQLTSITLPDGHEIVREYYSLAEATVGARGQLSRIYQRVGGVLDPHLGMEFAYDANGHLAGVTDARSKAASFAKDDLGRVRVVANALQEETHYTFAGPDGTAPGRLPTEVQVGRTSAAGEGQVKRFSYDGRGNLLSVQRKGDNGVFSAFVSFTYDSRDRRLAVTDGELHTTRFAYDPLGRLEHTVDPEGRETSFGYNASGWRTRITDNLGNETRVGYDDLGRSIEVETLGTIPAESTRVAYDAAGNVTAVTDPAENTTTYEFDALSRLRSMQPPLGLPVTYDYDPRGRLARVVNGRGNRLDYVYEPWGPIESIEHYPNVASPSPVRTVSYAYDLAGNLTSTSDDDFQAGPLYTFAYDDLNRIDLVTAEYLPGGDRTLDASYDRFGNLDGLTLVDGAETLTHAFTFDKLNRLSHASLPGPAGVGSQNLDFAYFADDALRTITRPGGRTTQLTYWPSGFVKDIDAQEAVLDELSYTYDALGRVATRVDRDGAHSYGYDEASRIIQAVHPSGTTLPVQEEFAWDLAQNREDPADPGVYAYDANNRVLQSPGLTYSHDDDGNRIAQSDGASFGWDFTNRLRTFARGTTSASYAYDPFGRRIRKTVNGATTYFLWYGDRLLAEVDASGARRVRYAYAGPFGFAPAQVAFRSGGSESLYDVHSDHLDTPHLLTDGTGAAKWQASYETFGAAHVDEDPDRDLANISFSIRAPGQYYDVETGLHYNRFRHYDPRIGRYISADPIGQLGALAVEGVSLARFSPLERQRGAFGFGEALAQLAPGFDRLLRADDGTPNLYEYVLNDPINWIDPSGLIKFPSDPSQVPPNWTPDPSHRDPNGQRFRDPNGRPYDFHPGRPGKPGWGGKDHWHCPPDKTHHRPGDEIPDSEPDPGPLSPDPPKQFNLPPPPWWLPFFLPILWPVFN